MKKLLLTLLTFLIAVNVAYPQLAIRHRLATPRPADSLDIDYYSHKRGLQAGTMVFGINMGVWAFDRHISDVLRTLGRRCDDIIRTAVETRTDHYYGRTVSCFMDSCCSSSGSRWPRCS